MTMWLLWAVAALHTADCHLLWLDWLPHMQWTLYHLRTMTSNNLISSVTCARSTKFGNMYLLKLNETPATPHMTSGSRMYGWTNALWFSYFLFCRMNIWPKNICKKELIYEKKNWTIWFSLHHILCIGVSISQKQLFTGSFFPPDRFRELNNFSLITDFACTLWVSVRFDKIRPPGAKISEKE